MSAPVVVLGAGPAGAAAAAALARSGMAVTLVAPAPRVPWEATYGVWVDERQGLADLPADPFRVRWPVVSVVGARMHRLERAYGLLDNVAVQQALLDAVTTRGGTVVTGRAAAVEAAEEGVSVHLDGGSVLPALLAVDARGGAARDDQVALQVAWGLVARCDRPPAEPGSCVLMDWSAPTGDDGRDPTFLYAMDLGEGWWFLEETSLARRPGLPLDVLQARLQSRLAACGVRVIEVARTEQVSIVMDAPRVQEPSGVVAFGAAAAMVHPATGYSVAASLRTAPRLADAVAAAVARRATPDAVVDVARRAVWPPARRRARALEQYGLEVLLGLDQRSIQQFFDTFFDLPSERWAPYLAGAPDARSVMRTMSAVFAAAPASLRRRLASADPRSLAGLLAR